MSNIYHRFKQQFVQSNSLLKLLYINTAVFLIIKIVQLTLTLFNVSSSGWIQYLELPSNIAILIRQPWTLLTYMFLHIEFFHFLFNMLCLYWFGQLFTYFFNQKQLVGVYIWGGIAGGLLYILSYNIFPLFTAKVAATYMLGASAAVMAIMVAVALKAPNYQVRLFLIGNVKLKYIAIIMVLTSFFGITSFNAGGEISHIGGALFGWLYTLALNNGKDLAKPITAILNWFTNLGKSSTEFFKPRQRFKVKKNKQTKTDAEYNQQKAANNKEVDVILDKIKHSGYGSLTAEEKQRLFDKSKNL